MAELVREARGTTARVASVVVDHQWVIDCRQVARLVVVDIQLTHATLSMLDAAADSWRGVGQEMIDLIHNQVPHAHLSVASPGLCSRPADDAVTRPDSIDPHHLLQAHRYRPTFKRNGHDAHRRRWLRRNAAS